MSSNPENSTSHQAISRSDLIDGFREAGLKRGDVALVHSAMRTFGLIDGGAESVIDALLEVLGPDGTLVVPTFTFAHEAEDEPIIDPAVDRAEMGVITETARLRPDAKRSIAYRHSFAAIGRRAAMITEVDPALPVFDFRSSFGVMLALDAQIVLLGVTYMSCTSHHFAEFASEVPYRKTIERNIKVRRPDGSVHEQPITDYQPNSYTGSRRPDFNRLGKMLEDLGSVARTFIGNAAVRRLAMRDLLDLAQREAAVDYNIFRTPEGDTPVLTELEFGQCVMSPAFPDGAGRPNSVQWCVKDLAQLQMPE